MNTTTFSDGMLNRLITDLPKCPTSLMIQKCNETWREFCHWTRCWKMALDPINLQEGVHDYDIADEVPAYAELDSVFASAVTSDYSLDPVGTAQMPGRDFDLVDKSVYYLRSAPSTDVRNGLLVTLSLQPTITATEIETCMIEKYLEYVVYGVKGKLMGMVGQPWSNPQMSGFNTGMFDYWKGIVRGEVMNTEGTTTFQNMKPRWDFC